MPLPDLFKCARSEQKGTSYGVSMSKNLVEYGAILLGAVGGFVGFLVIYGFSRGLILDPTDIRTVVILILVRTILSLFGIGLFGLGISQGTKIFVENRYSNVAHSSRPLLLWYAIAGTGIGMIIYYHFVGAFTL
jgi:hypothetical protein